MTDTTAEAKGYLPQKIARLAPFTVDRGEGSWVVTTDGERYLDFVAGIGVTNTGHAHPKVVAAAQAQLGKMLHAQQNQFYHQPMLDLTERIIEITPDGIDKVFFASTGAEAVENACKIAKQATRRPGVIAFHNSFHGRTHYTMALTCSKVAQRGTYEPLAGSVYHAPFCYPFRTPAGENPTEWALAGLERLFINEIYPEDVAAIVLEPVQGEGGFIVPEKEWVQALRRLCDEHGICLIADEIQSGMGRTGTWFAMEHFGVVPDLITISKGIASGLPVSVVAGRSELIESIRPGGLGGTFNGNVVACAAGVATVDAMREEGMLANATRQGEKFRVFLDGLKAEYNVIGDARGIGLMNMIELVEPGTKKPNAAAAKALIGECVKRKLLVFGCCAQDQGVRFLPPINVSDDDLEFAFGVITEAAAAAWA
ncbi:MAG: aspartate aminotransferase family protein [Thermoleophilia bacterium]